MGRQDATSFESSQTALTLIELSNKMADSVDFVAIANARSVLYSLSPSVPLKHAKITIDMAPFNLSLLFYVLILSSDSSQMAYMFDTGVDSGETQNPISVALRTTGGKEIQPLVAEKTKILEVGPLTAGAPIILTNVNRSSPYVLHTWNELRT